MRLTRLKKIAAGGGALALGAGMCAVISLSGALPAAAVNNTAGGPAGTPILYETDCTTAAQAGQVAPFVTSTVINTFDSTTNPVNQELPAQTPPAGFGVDGAVSQTIAGNFIAGINAQVNPIAIGMRVNQTFSSTNGNATGSFNYLHTFATIANPGGQIATAYYASGVTTLSGDFTGVPAGASLSGPGIPSSAFTTGAGTGTSIGINAATTTDDQGVAGGPGTGPIGTGTPVGWAPAAGVTFTDTGFATANNTFATNGPSGGTAGIGLTSTTTFALATSSTAGVNGTVLVTFGGTGAGCTQTGYGPSNAPGPGQAPASGPVFPPGVTTPLISVAPSVQFQPGAYVNLVQPITVSPSSTSLGTDLSKTINLVASPATGKTLTSCDLVPLSISNARLQVTVSLVGTTCQAALHDTGSGSLTVTFQFTATDTTISTSSAATVTVNIGVPVVDQQINQQVNPGLLQVSCSAPGSVGYPALSCPLITLTPIALTGQNQTSTSASSPIYVSDNRGDPTVGWSLSTYMVPTAGNSNAACSSAKDFCNSTVGAAASNPNGQIPASDLAITAPVWTVTSGTNAAPTGTALTYSATPQGLGTLAAGISGGTFEMNTTYTLSIPGSVYSGLYMGTVEFLVA